MTLFTKHFGPPGRIVPEVNLRVSRSCLFVNVFLCSSHCLDHCYCVLIEYGCSSKTEASY